MKSSYKSTDLTSDPFFSIIEEKIRIGGDSVNATVIEEELKKIVRKEKKLCEPEKKSRKSTIEEKIDSKMPNGMEEKLDAAFYKGFQVVFKKGNTIIEKTYDKEKRKEEFDIQNYAFSRRNGKKAIQGMNQKSGIAKWCNIGITAVEGTALGLFGVGLPDVPVFIGMMLKSIYEVAMSYGFSYEEIEEQDYILKLIEAALTDGTDKKKKIEELDEKAAKMEHDVVEEIDLNTQMKLTANVLSKEMLYMKFVQGIPVVGAIGGAINVKYLSKITEFSRMEYQKRYFMKNLHKI